MKIIFNNSPLELPLHDATLGWLIEWKGVAAGGMAVAVNNKLVVRSKWDTFQLHEGDNVVVISAAFGG